MQVFFTNPANSSVLLIKNRLTSRLLSESVEIVIIILFSFSEAVPFVRLIVLIVIVTSAGAFLILGAADLDEPEDFCVGKLDALEHLLDIAVGGGAFADNDYIARDPVL